MTRMLKTVPLLPLLTLVSACSGEPSGSQLEKAFRTAAEPEFAQLNKMAQLMGQPAVELESVKKISCKASDQGPGFACAAEIKVKSGDKTSKEVTTIPIIKGDDGWQVLK